jgi:hypothetical protein
LYTSIKSSRSSYSAHTNESIHILIYYDSITLLLPSDYRDFSKTTRFFHRSTMSSSSPLSDCIRGLAQGGSRRAGSWNSSDPQTLFGSSTPRARRRDTSQPPSSTSRESFPSSPPIVFGRTPSSRDPSPTPTGPTSTAVENLTSSFEKWNNDTFFRYKEEYNATWCKWIDTRPEFKSFVDALPRDKRTSVRNRGMNWGNMEYRSSPFWEHFQEGASSRGVPQIRCVWCMQIIQHPIKNGNSGMKDHYESKKCITQRRKKVQDPAIVDALRKQGEKVLTKPSLELSF